jgi:hypothetical protein
MKVKDLLSSPEKWTQQAYAKTKHGIATSSSDPDAFCFCLLGAVHKCYSIDEIGYINQKIQRNIEGAIAEWNDDPTRTFEEVKQLVESLNI